MAKLGTSGKTNKPCVALVLPGGGARGAYQVGVLKAIAEFMPGELNPFPIITGVSVGAINSVTLAIHAAHFSQGVKWLETLWAGLHAADVYRTDYATVVKTGLHWLAALTLGGLGVSNPRSLLNNAPLKDLLTRELNFSKIEKAVNSGNLRAVGVTASSYGQGKAITFFQGAAALKGWQRARRDGVRQRLGVEHVLSSTALPLIFPAQRLVHDYFADGSMRLTSPLSPAIHFGADRIFVIGSRDEITDPAPTADCRCGYPTLGQIGGYALDVLFNDNLKEDIERARRINQTISLLSPKEARKTSLRKIEILTVRPSQDIREITRKHARHIPPIIRMLLRGTGAWDSGWQLPSYLLFEPPFCQELIALGYRDTLAQKADICDFLELPAN